MIFVILDQSGWNVTTGIGMAGKKFARFVVKVTKYIFRIREVEL